MKFQKGNAGRPKGAKGKKQQLLVEWGRGVLESQAYRDALKKRLIAGTANSAEVTMLYHYCYGRPRQTLDVNMQTPMLDAAKFVNGLSAEEFRVLRPALLRMGLEK